MSTAINTEQDFQPILSMLMRAVSEDDPVAAHMHIRTGLGHILELRASKQTGSDRIFSQFRALLQEAQTFIKFFRALRLQASSSNTALRQAVARRDSKADPLDKLPDDVLASIFKYVPEKRILCIGLSRAWRARMINLPVWQILKIDLKNKLPEGIWQDGLCQVLHPSLESVSVTTDVPLCTPVSLLAESGCINIQRFSITDENGCSFGSTAPDADLYLNKRFVSNVQKLASSYLTDLRIVSRQIPCNLILLLLQLCPNLTLLSCSFPSDSSAMTVSPVKMPAEWRPNKLSPRLRILQTPYTTHSLDSLIEVSSLKGLILCGSFNDTWRQYIEAGISDLLKQPSNPEIRHIHLLDSGSDGDSVLRHILADRDENEDRVLHGFTCCERISLSDVLRRKFVEAIRAKDMSKTGKAGFNFRIYIQHISGTLGRELTRTPSFTPSISDALLRLQHLQILTVEVSENYSGDVSQLRQFIQAAIAKGIKLTRLKIIALSDKQAYYNTIHDMDEFFVECGRLPKLISLCIIDQNPQRFYYGTSTAPRSAMERFTKNSLMSRSKRVFKQFSPKPSAETVLQKRMRPSGRPSDRILKLSYASRMASAKSAAHFQAFLENIQLSAFPQLSFGYILAEDKYPELCHYTEAAQMYRQEPERHPGI
ncbi:hypothetical protein BCR43DRAFT_513232 [Syncephalastrum racemosum]|uniref:F-box domain-containing protein n=1 Tax=Syncephalastrum racemosum TaxID=13706 RepID=A0A1X2HJ74_SYNRA|nr:hypothetical protein BCR43DRAFT_513232 [Syncephalastrum racemosum]